jgi:glycosyltransferase involved in cell wall biosynthesis
MRIAVVSRHFSRAGGGAESYAVALVQGLASRHDVHVFSQTSNHPVPGVTYHKVFCLCQKPRWINQLFFAISTWRQTRRGYDIVHSHENTWQGQIQTLHVRPVRHNLFHSYRGLRRIFRWAKVALSPRLITYLLLEASRFRPHPTRHLVATSNHLRQECEEAYPHCIGKIKVITPGVHLPDQYRQKADARKVLGLPVEGRVILFVANDYPRKGLDTLLKSLRLMPPDVILVVVGNSNAAPKYRQHAQQLGIEDRVHFLGSLGDPSLAYAAADCLAHPTLEDSFAMVVLEAMAHGLPVIVSGPDRCGISRQLTDGVNALLLSDPKNERALAALIGKVFCNQDMANDLRESGLRFAKQYSWDGAILQYERLYSQVDAQSITTT